MQSVLASAATPQTINFTYPTCDCTVTLNAVDSGGTVISSIYGGVNAAPTTIATGEFWYGIWGSISGGTGTMKVQSDVEYTFSPYVWDSSYVQGDDVKGTCSNGAASVNLSMLALDATISGSYLDDAGSALSTDNYSYISVYSTKDRAYRSCTTSSDSYTCAVSSGRWCLGYWIDPSSGFASSSAGASTNCIDITSGSSTTRNLTLLRTGSISVSVLGADGNAKQNVWVEAAPYSNADRGANDYQYMYMSSGCMTDSSGTCTINVGASSAGVVYYLNAYIPYYMKSSENLLNPQEVSVTVTAGATVTASALTFEKPDGTSVITVTQAAAATSLSFGKSASKSLINPDTSTSSSPAIGATVDCFSTSGGSFEAETDNNGVATCPCMTVDTWKAVAHNKVSNNLWMSEASDITCTVEGGAGSAAMSNVAILPEGKSVSVSDASSMSLTLELSDGFSVYFPNGSLSNSAESVTCKADTTVTPFTANRRPASFYGYVVECQKDSTGASIVQLNSNATFTVPINQTQVENLGLSMTDVEMTYFSDSIGAYSVVDNGYTTDSTRLLITYQQNHMTSFTVVGNGNLAGVAGGEAGDGGNEYAADAAGSSGCGCKVGARPADGDWIWGPLLIFVTAGLLWVAKRRGKCRGGL
jgi:hypothetical protein